MHWPMGLPAHSVPSMERNWSPTCSRPLASLHSSIWSTVCFSLKTIPSPRSCRLTVTVSCSVEADPAPFGASSGCSHLLSPVTAL